MRKRRWTDWLASAKVTQSWLGRSYWLGERFISGFVKNIFIQFRYRSSPFSRLTVRHVERNISLKSLLPLSVYCLPSSLSLCYLLALIYLGLLRCLHLLLCTPALHSRQSLLPAGHIHLRKSEVPLYIFHFEIWFTIHAFVSGPVSIHLRHSSEMTVPRRKLRLPSRWFCIQEKTISSKIYKYHYPFHNFTFDISFFFKYKMISSF